MKFLDVHPAFNAGGYFTTNEAPELFARLLGERQFTRGGGICSGGEVALFVLLPRCNEVVLVDHAYHSLTVAFAKFLLLDLLAPQEFLRLLLEESFTVASRQVQQLLKDNEFRIPATLRSHLSISSDPNDGTFSQHGIASLRYEYKNYPDALEALTAARGKLANVTLLHGDLQDLRAYAPLDVLYLSNAMEHSNRDRRSPQLNEFKDVIPAGGILLGTGGGGFGGTRWDSPTGRTVRIDITNVWAELPTAQGRTHWYHRMLQRKQTVPELSEVAS